MAKGVDGVLKGMQILLQDPQKMAKVDHTVAPIEWNEAEFSSKKKLRIGYYECDATFPAIPSCRRAVREAVTLLQQSGHTLVKFEPPGLKELQYLYFHHSLADGGSNALKWLEGDVIDQSIQVNMLVWKLPKWFKDTVVRFVKQ